LKTGLKVLTPHGTPSPIQGLCVLQGIAELLDVQVPRILFLIRRMQELLGKKYVSELPDSHVRVKQQKLLFLDRQASPRPSSSLPQPLFSPPGPLPQWP
jgi:hypothetical protein